MSAVISVIIPVYNRECELRCALDSIISQTYKNFEVIVVDDGSEPPISVDPRGIDFKLLRQANSGAPNARNNGFAISSGEYVIFWDSDVIAEPEMLEKMLNVLSIHSEASYTYSNFYFGNKKMSAMKFDAHVLKERNYIHTTSLIRRKDFINFDESLSRFQDWDLWLALLNKDKIGIYIPEYLFKVIPHKNGISAWLPKFAYKAPFRFMPWIKGKVEDYERAKETVLKKYK